MSLSARVELAQMAVLVVEPEQEQEELPMVVVELALRIFPFPFRWFGYLGSGRILGWGFGWPLDIYIWLSDGFWFDAKLELRFEYIQVCGGKYVCMCIRGLMMVKGDGGCGNLLWLTALKRGGDGRPYLRFAAKLERETHAVINVQLADFMFGCVVKNTRSGVAR